MKQISLSNFDPLQFIEFLATELKIDYEYFITKLEDMPSSNSAFDYLNGYTDSIEEILGLVASYLRIKEHE